MVDVPLPAVIGEVAATVDTLADTAPAFTTTVAVWVIATALIVAETVFDSVAVDGVAETVPAFTTTVAVCVTATALIVADTVFEPAAVELRLPVATPLALVVPTGWVSVLPVPVAA